MIYWSHTLYGRLPVIDYNNSMGSVRYLLALAVFIAHFNVVFGTRYYFPISSYNAVGAFFTISGFLLYGSYLKSPDIKGYFVKRAKRILPPYLLIVLLCAFGLSVVSIYGYRDYFSNSNFFKYIFYNSFFMNFMAPELPGVFADSPVHAVNGSLWTMKVEIMLYITVPFVLFLSYWFNSKFPSRSPLIIFVIIYIFSMFYRTGFYLMYEYTEKEIYNILGRQFTGQLMYFYSGVIIYIYYQKFLRYLAYLIPISLGLCLLGNFIPYYSITLEPVFISVFVIAISSFKGNISVFNKNNISYDIYLFHFPIIQLFYQYKDVLNVSDEIIFILILLAVIFLSFVSWFLIEKPILSKRRNRS